MPYPNYFNNYYGNANSNYPNQTMQPIVPQIQNGGFIVVKNEQEIYNYPVGCGNSVNFKLENAPYLYTKTMSFSQFDKPVIEKYKLVKEDTQETIVEEKKPEVDNSDLDSIKGEIEDIWKEIEAIKKEISNGV